MTTNLKFALVSQSLEKSKNECRSKKKHECYNKKRMLKSVCKGCKLGKRTTQYKTNVELNFDIKYAP